MPTIINRDEAKSTLLQTAIIACIGSKGKAAAEIVKLLREMGFSVTRAAFYMSINRMINKNLVFAMDNPRGPGVYMVNNRGIAYFNTHKRVVAELEFV